MNETDNTYYFSFSFNGPDGESIVFNFDCPDDTGWKEVQDRFNRFLSSVYGYDVADTVVTSPVTPAVWDDAVRNWF